MYTPDWMGPVITPDWMGPATDCLKEHGFDEAARWLELVPESLWTIEEHLILNESDLEYIRRFMDREAGRARLPWVMVGQLLGLIPRFTGEEFLETQLRIYEKAERLHQETLERISRHRVQTGV